MKKVVLTPKMAEKIQDDIFKKMTAEKKIKLTLKISHKIFKMVEKEIKLKYPNIDKLPLFRRCHKHIETKREFYDDMFNCFLKKELISFKKVDYNFMPENYENRNKLLTRICFGLR